MVSFLFKSEGKRCTFRVEYDIHIYTNTVLEYSVQGVVWKEEPTGGAGPCTGWGRAVGTELLDGEDRKDVFVEQRQKGGKKKEEERKGRRQKRGREVQGGPKSRWPCSGWGALLPPASGSRLARTVAQP